MNYNAFVLLPVPDDKDELIDRATRELTQGFSGLGHVERSTDGFALVIDGWRLRGKYTSEPHVLAESRDLVDHFGGDRADAELLRTFGARLELSSEPADPTMDHFNDYMIACQRIEHIEQAIAIDMAGPEFMSGKILPG